MAVPTWLVVTVAIELATLAAALVFVTAEDARRWLRDRSRNQADDDQDENDQHEDGNQKSDVHDHAS